MYQSKIPTKRIAKNVKTGCVASLATAIIEPSTCVSSVVSMMGLIQGISVSDVSSIGVFKRISVRASDTRRPSQIIVISRLQCIQRCSADPAGKLPVDLPPQHFVITIFARLVMVVVIYVH